MNEKGRKFELADGTILKLTGIDANAEIIAEQMNRGLIASGVARKGFFGRKDMRVKEISDIPQASPNLESNKNCNG
ncbi:MAG: hypothetical protein HYT11_00125 [Candidatus Levybacteria bacterium]|nr:hypothetical protein [Candidatus Levybacteria bacterium]